MARPDEAADQTPDVARRSPVLAFAIALGLPLASLGIYLYVGDLRFGLGGGDNPAELSLPDAGADLERARVVLEERLQKKPGGSEGQDDAGAGLCPGRTLPAGRRLV